MRSKLTHLAAGGEFKWQKPFPPSISTRGGWTVDLSTVVWVLPLSSRKLDWRTIQMHDLNTLHASQAFVVHQLQTHSVAYAEESFRVIKIISNTQSFKASDQAQGVISAAAVVEAREFVQKTNRHWRGQFNMLRRWYYWCAAMNFPTFSPDVVRYLRRLRTGPDPNYGRAILSGDGPLTTEECRRVVQALKQAEAKGNTSPKELTLVWLLLCIGANIGPISQLRESDLQREGPYWFLRVPRHKKRDSKPRSQFKFRRIPTYLAQLIQACIQTHRDERNALGLDNSLDWPLFYRANPWTVNGASIPDPLSLHELGDRALNGYLGYISRKFGIRDRNGEPLRLSARRFRYTLATELVRDGAPPVAVAEALDHSSLRHIMVYYNARSEIIPRLDKALTKQLAPIYEAFQGNVIGKEAESPRGNDPGSRIFFGDASQGLFIGVGNCGCFGKCRLASPIACYTCKLYHPWAEAPHQLLLDQLLERRDRAEAEGQEPNVVQLYDHTIIAIQQVIDLCSTFVPQGGSDGVPHS